ncbi:hypothetical protein CRM22_011241 [Opisthorchis felineus]|uniref:Uncharacterized protein n=1 Tax=Opisthorchis felineus TaxID=147828 RepID=A0A4S2K0Z9_OPIFE|nr:hypothetical protein CRM22_011241 [Opisthorchis felineus]
MCSIFVKLPSIISFKTNAAEILDAIAETFKAIDLSELSDKLKNPDTAEVLTKDEITATISSTWDAYGLLHRTALNQIIAQNLKKRVMTELKKQLSDTTVSAKIPEGLRTSLVKVIDLLMRRKQESPKVLLDGITKELAIIGAGLTVPVAKQVLEVYNKAIAEIIKEENLPAEVAVFSKFRIPDIPDERLEQVIHRPQSMRVYTIMPQSHEMWQDLLEALNVDDVSEYDICKGMESVLKDVNIPPFGCSQIPKFPKNGEEKSVKIYIAECKNTEAKVSTDIKTKIHQALNVEASLPVNVTIGPLKDLWSTTADVTLASNWETDDADNLEKEYESRKEFEENTLIIGEVLLFQPIADENKAKIFASFDDTKYKMSELKDKLMTKVKPAMGSTVYITEINAWIQGNFPWEITVKCRSSRSAGAWSLYVIAIVATIRTFF